MHYVFSSVELLDSEIVMDKSRQILILDFLSANTSRGIQICYKKDKKCH